MNREKAVELFKEVTSACKLNITSVSLIMPVKNTNDSDGYQLHIKSFLSGVDREELQVIAAKNGFVWKEENDTIIIYKPKRNYVI